MTPPPELFHDLCSKPWTWQDRLELAYQAGADAELEACCEWLQGVGDLEPQLRAARRRPPQTLNSIALQMLGTIERDGQYIPEITNTIRRALEQLPDQIGEGDFNG